MTVLKNEEPDPRLNLVLEIIHTEDEHQLGTGVGNLKRQI